ncbi:MAG: hypothetical protein KIS96_03360 [Bauldia sp.]|nr:hypothetical protein [Bauldia sp.]
MTGLTERQRADRLEAEIVRYLRGRGIDVGYRSGEHIMLAQRTYDFERQIDLTKKHPQLVIRIADLADHLVREGL